MQRTIWATVAMFMMVATAVAQDEPRRGASLEDARRFTDVVMQKIGNDEMAGAFEIIAENLPVPAEEIKRLQAKAMEMRNRAAGAGKLIGVSYVRQEIAGDVFARFTYVQKFERTAIVWHFTFYKPTDRWMLHAFAWHTNPAVLFDGAPPAAAADN